MLAGVAGRTGRVGLAQRAECREAPGGAEMMPQESAVGPHSLRTWRELSLPKPWALTCHWVV